MMFDEYYSKNFRFSIAFNFVNDMEQVGVPRKKIHDGYKYKTFTEDIILTPVTMIQRFGSWNSCTHHKTVHIPKEKIGIKNM